MEPRPGLGTALPAAEPPVVQATRGGGVWTGQCRHVPVSAGLLGTRPPPSPPSTSPSPSLLGARPPPCCRTPLRAQASFLGPRGNSSWHVVCGARDARRGSSPLSAVAEMAEASSPRGVDAVWSLPPADSGRTREGLLGLVGGARRGSRGGSQPWPCPLPICRRGAALLEPISCGDVTVPRAPTCWARVIPLVPPHSSRP